MLRFITALMFIASSATAQEAISTLNECEWGGSSAKIVLSETEDHFADLKLENIISGGHDDVIHCFMTLEDLEVVLRVEHVYGNFPDRHTIHVSEGFYAEVVDFQMKERTESVVKIYRKTVPTS